jgi:hypothetical protein
MKRQYAERDALILGMRAAGASFREIALALGSEHPSLASRSYHRAVRRRDEDDFVAPSAERPIDEEGPHFVAWAAGFFDGEGCISAGVGLIGGRTKTHLLVVVSQTTPEPLLAIQRHWGGNIRDIQPTQRTWQHQWTWRIHGKAAGPFLRDIQPYLLVKRRHVDLALQYIALIKPKGQPVSAAEQLERIPFIEGICELNARRHTRRAGSGRRAAP